MSYHSDYTLSKKEYSNLKRRLTKAEKLGNPTKILEEVEHAFRIFEEKGYPDDWTRWERAQSDAEILQHRL